MEAIYCSGCCHESLSTSLRNTLASVQPRTHIASCSLQTGSQQVCADDGGELGLGERQIRIGPGQDVSVSVAAASIRSDALPLLGHAPSRLLKAVPVKELEQP